jgi:hypothetical protein
MIEINRVGQVPHGLISCLTESCLAQHVNHILPGVLHSDHSSLKNRCVPGTRQRAGHLRLYRSKGRGSRDAFVAPERPGRRLSRAP